MGSIISSYIFPHPPIIVPEVGRGNEEGAQETIIAAQKVAEDIKNDKPTTIIVTTPHGPVFQDFIYISTGDRIHGDLSKFGAGNVKLEYENNPELVNKIIEEADNSGIFAGGLEDSFLKKHKISKELDHGALVPLYFVNKKYKDFKLVHISIAGLPFLELYKFGMCISKAVEKTDERVVFIGSGDLSHRLSKEAPYGYDKNGKQFDDMLVNSVKSLDVKKLLEADEEFCEAAGECGLRSFLMMFGALDGYELKSEVYSYEGPFGVGYSVARIDVGERNSDREIYSELKENHKSKLSSARENESPYVSLARKSLEEYITSKKIVKPSSDMPGEMLNNSAGAFVSIKKHGQLRGCIGTTAPTRDNVAEEIIYNAISSGTRDPRFDAVDEDELSDLVYSVDVLREPEKINSMEELDVIKYGVIVRAGGRSGLLLPNLEGVDTPEKQVSIALQKAGIKPNDRYEMERFEVIRYK